MDDLELLGGGNKPLSEVRYFNINFEGHRTLKVYIDGRHIRDCLEADVNARIVRIPDALGKTGWMLGAEVIKTSLSINQGFVEIKDE